MLRKFEHPGPPRKFLELDYRQGSSLRYRWHSEGRSPQDHLRSFDTHDEAAQFAEREIAKQLAAGYVEVGAPVPPADQVAPAPDQAVMLERSERFTGKASGKARFVLLVQEGPRVTQVAGDDGEEADERTRRTIARGTIAEASLEYERIAQDLVADGFTSPDRTSSGVRRQVVAVAKSNPELEEACLATDDEDMWAVYADWLIANDDPRGEIAQLHLAGRTTEARRVLAANLEQLCGDALRGYDLTFRHGFARGATIVRDRANWDSPGEGALDQLVRDFLASPMGRFIDGLRLGLAGFSDANTWAPAIQAVIDSPNGPRLRELRTDAWEYSDCEISWARFGDLAFAWQDLPSLELLHIKSGAGGNLGLLELPRLRTLIRESGGLGAEELAQILDAIREGRMPALAHLELWTGSSGYGAAATTAILRPILDGDHLPNLVHLGIVNSELTNDVVDILAHSPLLPRLHSLDLSRGTLAERGTRYFVENAPAFRHLASIDLSRNLLVPSEADAIRAVLDNVILVDQRERDDEDHDEDDPEPEQYRYVDVGE